MSEFKKIFVLLPVFFVLAACSLLKPVELPQVQKYVFSVGPQTNLSNNKHKVLAINIINNSSIFNTEKIIYTIRPRQIGAFVKHEWADTPAKLLEPVILNRLLQSHVHPVLNNFPGNAQYILVIQIIKLQQNYYSDAAYAQVQIKADLINNKTKLLISSLNFSGEKQMQAKNPVSGVHTINDLISDFSQQLLVFVNRNIR